MESKCTYHIWVVLLRQFWRHIWWWPKTQKMSIESIFDQFWWPSYVMSKIGVNICEPHYVIFFVHHLHSPGCRTVWPWPWPAPLYSKAVPATPHTSVVTPKQAWCARECPVPQSPCCTTGLPRVREKSGKNKIFSRSGNCQGILKKCQGILAIWPMSGKCQGILSWQLNFSKND